MSWTLLCRACNVTYIRTAQNIGFGKAHNVAFDHALPSKYHLVLNPDVQFDQGVLEELYGFLELNESVGLVMPRVLYPDGSPQNLCKRLPTPIDIFAKRLLSRAATEPRAEVAWKLLNFWIWTWARCFPCLIYQDVSCSFGATRYAMWVDSTSDFLCISKIST